MYLTGTEGDDILIGGADDDTLLGLGGDDLLIGGAGNNMLDGGAGNDTVSYETTPGLLALSVNLSAGTVWYATAAGQFQDKLVSIENVIGSSLHDVVFGSIADNHIRGGDGIDFISGGGGKDVLDGGDGNDYLTTLFGPAVWQPGSLMIGGGGNDTLESGNSNDTMLGGDGDDLFKLANYATTRSVDGGAGIDTLSFPDEITPYVNGITIDLNKAVNTVTPGLDLTITNVENVTGTNAADTLIGDSFANVLSGGAGNDVLVGRGGADTLIGGDGDDLLDGGVGQDVLNGGAGADIFQFVTGDSLTTAPDTIVSFTAEDRIRFSDGPAGDAGNYVELAAPDVATVDALFAGTGVRYVAMQAGGLVYLYADVGDEGTTYDQLIILTGTNLSAIDATSILGL